MRFSRRAVIATALLLVTTGFGIYLFTLYRQLEAAFTQQEEFTPTRFYSDVTRIAPPPIAQADRVTTQSPRLLV